LRYLFLIFFFVYLYVRNKYVNQPTNFKVFFILGIVFILMGIAMKFYVFTIMGLIFMIIGLANKKKWREFEGK